MPGVGAEAVQACEEQIRAPRIRSPSGRQQIIGPPFGVLFLVALASIISLSPDIASARVLRLEVERRAAILDGRAFGDRGGFELIEGRVYFGLSRRRAMPGVRASQPTATRALPSSAPESECRAGNSQDMAPNSPRKRRR